MKRDEPLNRQYPNVSTIGNPVNTIYGYISDGLIKDQAMLDAYDKTHGFANFPLMPGDIKYKDIADVNGNTDNVINTNDRVAMGYPTVPEIIYGFGPSIKFKNLDFSFFFQGAARTSLMMSGFHPLLEIQIRHGEEFLILLLKTVGLLRIPMSLPNILG